MAVFRWFNGGPPDWDTKKPHRSRSKNTPTRLAELLVLWMDGLERQVGLNGHSIFGVRLLLRFDLSQGLTSGVVTQRRAKLFVVGGCAG